ncbi:MAG: transposase family protein [Dehalococcoidales bacterium]|nr:transposase family protein [Dehalococcoidales bacterium]
MARGQENGITILLGLKDYKVGEVVGGEDRVVVMTGVKGEKKCPYCGSATLYGHGVCKPREVLHTWSNGRKVYLELHHLCSSGLCTSSTTISTSSGTCANTCASTGSGFSYQLAFNWWNYRRGASSGIAHFLPDKAKIILNILNT